MPTGLHRTSSVLLRAASLLVFLLLGTAWRGAPLSTLDPAGPSAREIADVWWVMFWGGMAITLFMVALGLYVVVRNPERRMMVPSRTLVIGGGVIFPAVVVTALLVYGIARGPLVWPAADDENAFHVDVIGHRWWWEVRYPQTDGTAIHDANEIHIPVDRPVVVHVTTADVIHSFWVPRLAGKIDAIPGIVNSIRIQADRAGVYRGTCSEFCGLQHARMGFLVIAREEKDLRAHLQQLAASIDDPAESPHPGASAFERHCSICHSVDRRSMPLSPGPNLAAVSERRTLGAGVLPNGEGALRRWIVDQEELKPGNLMPSMRHLPPEVVDQIVSYLRRRS